MVTHVVGGIEMMYAWSWAHGIFHQVGRREASGYPAV
jgi:hypothetical protein